MLYASSRKVSKNTNIYVNKFEEDVNKYRFNKAVSKFGNPCLIKLIKHDYHVYSKLFFERLTTTVLFVFDIPDDNSYMAIISDDNSSKRLILNKHSRVVFKSLYNYSITVCRYSEVYISNKDSVTALLCNYDYVPSKNILFYKTILISPYILEWEIKWYKKIKIVYDEALKIKNRLITGIYDFNSRYGNVTTYTKLHKDYDVLYRYLTTCDIHSIKQEKCIMQGLRWPLGKSSLIFFRLWALSAYSGIEKTINVNRLIKILKKITRKKITQHFGLGDLLIATFNVVRKQANKLKGTLLKEITFKNLWRDIAIVQLMRIIKFSVKEKLKKKIELQTDNYIYAPINPWMVNIEEEIQLCENVRNNILDKHKWPKDWPELGVIN